jgi:ATP-dependent RNA helicase DeaD
MDSQTGTNMSNLEKFRELGISERVLEALGKKGFEEPSPIQAQTIPLLLQGEKDVIGQAQTGTGKTAAFGIPILEKIQQHCNHVQALILAPTRELAIQVAEEINSLKGNSPLEVMPIYGGQSIDIQLRRLNKGVDIVVGTLWRLTRFPLRCLTRRMKCLIWDLSRTSN